MHLNLNIWHLYHVTFIITIIFSKMRQNEIVISYTLHLISLHRPQQTNISSNSKIETLEKGVKYLQR